MLESAEVNGKQVDSGVVLDVKLEEAKKLITLKKAEEVKEKADGTTDVTKAGKNFPNFSVSKDALIRLGFQPQRDVGIWINDGDSNIPIRVWDQASGQNKQEAVEFDWTERRRELQQFAYKGK